MRELEHRFPRELAIVGVHSGKYHAERVTENIREAALRLGNLHPIVNDRQFRVWRQYAVRAWPTLVAIDPAGYVVGQHAGEFTSEMLEPFVERLIGAFDPAGELDRRSLDFAPDAPAIAPGLLRYPDKVAFDPTGARGPRLAIADTGHGRVLVGRLGRRGRSLRVERVLGGNGSRDEGGETSGGARRAALVAPHGLAFDGDTLYIADAGTHDVVAADLATGALRTIAGTGRQLRTRQDMARGALSSPWDLALVGRALHVAMAGVHRLWRIDLDDVAADGRAFAEPESGSGAEEIVDGPHRSAALAQPMGIVARGDGLYFVDAESSAVRRADLDPAGGVTTIVGTGLFDFGDADGVGDEVRMQHQQGLAVAPDGRLLVADSYNGALKWVDPATRRAETWLRGFAEPGGVALADGVAYVADTNAHRIAAADLATGDVEELAIEGVEQPH